MTRETKIGLLVGLAFIIVIGILLADHLAMSVEPAQAPLATTGANVRRSVTTIGQPVTTVQVIPPTSVEPGSTIATHTELSRPLPVVLDGSPPIITPEPDPIAARMPDAVQDLVLRNAAELALVGSINDPITTATPIAANAGQPNAAMIAQPTAASPIATSVYTVRPGDSLSRIAAKTMGSDTKANREAIVRANPTLAANPDMVIVGRQYVIPNGALPTAVRPEPVLAAARRGDTWYTVKSNDNLWRIAQSELGSGGAWTEIRDLNRDILKGKDAVQVGMKLRLPPRNVASAAN